MAALLRKVHTVKGTEKADWQEVCSYKIDPAAQAGSSERDGTNWANVAV